MFTTAFDASHDEHTFMIVAGFIAPADSWSEFDKAWRARLKKDNLSYFHMVDFAHSQREFASGWRQNEARRRAFLADLIEIIRKHASRKFGWVIENRVFAEHAPSKGWDQYYLDPYSFACMSCATDVMRWCVRDGTPQFEKIQFVFEKGDGDGDGQKKLKRWFDRIEMEVHFELKKDKQTKAGTIQRAFTPLQAADFLAYEV